jgi:hypothetical protein
MTRYRRTVQYYPIIAVFAFWLQGCLVGSFFVNKPHIITLGLVTLPFVICSALAWVRVARENRRLQKQGQV